MSYAKVVSGVYEIKNLCNGKVYIGSSINIYNRWGIHRAQLRNNYHPNIHLQRAWNKYGEASFRFQILLICEPEKVVLYEQKAIDKFDAFKNGYNRRPKAENCLGCHPSEETRKKIGDVHRGIPKSIEWRKMMSERMKGNHYGLGKKMPQSWVNKLIARNKGNTNTRGQKRSAEFCRRQSERNKGNTFGVANKGIKRSPETLKRMSMAQKKRYERERLEQGI